MASARVSGRVHVISSCVLVILMVGPGRADTLPSTQFVLKQSDVKILGLQPDEASGIAVSRKHKDVVYSFNDSGGKNRIYAINATSGRSLGVFTFGNFTPYDMEDIAVAPCTSGSADSCIYLADTGYQSYAPPPRNTIYRVKEPATLGDQNLAIHGELKFTWAEPNCDTMLVDPQGIVYVISSKVGGHGVMGKLPNSGWTSGDQRVKPERTVVTSAVASFTPPNPDWFNEGPTGADISSDGKEMLIRTYEQVLYWYVPDGDYLTAASNQTGRPVTSHPEPQGEGVAWTPDGKGYYTTSEGLHPYIYYFEREDRPIVG